MFESPKPKLNRNSLIQHPNGGYSFGTVPHIPAHGLPGGDIYLKHGEHRGKQRGWGAIHIWQGHRNDLAFRAFEDVAAYVARIATFGAGIYCEFASLRAPRLAILRSQAGLLIIEHRPLSEPDLAYSVITAYPRKTAHGVLVGKIEKAP